MRHAPAVALLLAAACSAPDEPSRPTANTRDSAGVQIVTSSEPEWRAGEGWQLDTIPIMVLGANEDEPQEQWTMVDAAIRLPDGSVVVAVDGALRRFGSTGQFERLMSGPGDGPGEFRDVGGLDVLPGDTLRVHDNWLTRVAYYTPDGRYAREEPPFLDRFIGLGRWVECAPMLLTDGTHLACQADSLAAKQLGDNFLDENDPGTRRRMVRRWAASPALDTAYPLGMFSGLTNHTVAVGGGRVVHASHPYDPMAQMAGGGTPPRIALWSSHDFRIEIWTPTGTLERIIQRQGARRAVPTEQSPYERDYVARSLSFSNVDPALRDRLVEKVPRPDSMPALVDLEFTNDGYLLVQREGHLAIQPSSIWDVFAPEGRFLGTFQLPGNARIIQAGTDFILVLRRSEEYGQLVEVYRVRR
jgi:hypothetical protein